MRLLAGAVLTAAVLVGCGGSSHDQTFLRLVVSHHDRLATEDHKTLITLGHEACDLLDQYRGDTTQVDSVFVSTAGAGGASFFTPSVMENLRAAATTAYCPAAT